MPTTRATSDPREFERSVRPLIEADPVAHSVVATNLARCIEHDVRDAFWLWLEDGGVPITVAIHTPPSGPYVATDDSEAGRQFAECLLEAGRAVGLVSGGRGGVDGFAAAWVRARGVTVTTAMEQGVFVLDELRLPQRVGGSFRPAHTDDVSLVNAWMTDFMLEAMGEADDRGLDAEIVDGRVGLWEFAGRPVSVAYASRPYAGVSRVSGVYTPPEHRGNGYASACVAEVSRRVVDGGNRCMLYTDLSNPTSNSIYTALGYRRHSEAVAVRLSVPTD